MNAQWITMIDLWVDRWAGGLWRACWQGSIAILLVWALCLILPRLAPSVRCWLWRLAFLKLLVAFFWAAPIEIPVLPALTTPPQTAAPTSAPEIAGLGRSGMPRMRTARHAVVTVDLTAHPSLTPLSALTALWLLGVVVVVAGIVREWRTARRRDHVVALDTARHPELAADFAVLCRRIGVNRPVALLVTAGNDRPHVYGVIRPQIVLPAALLAGADRDALQSILAHEIAHLRRQDLLWNWLPAVAQMLFFFHPLVWLANREWQAAQEIACDECAVLNTRTDVAEYGEILVRMVASARRSPVRGVAMLGIVETHQTLKRRLIAMRFINSVSRRRIILTGCACVTLGLPGIIPWQVIAQGAGGQMVRTNHILFVSNRTDAKRFSIFAMDPDGSHIARLTKSPVPEFEAVSSANGKTVLRPTASHRNEMELDPVWSPDGKRIAFAVAVPEKPTRGSKVKMNVYVMNADGSGCREVTHFDYGMSASSPVWSPDGKEIAFTLQFADKGAPGGISATICVTDLTGFWPIAEGMWASWSPDGKKILYSAFARGKDMKIDLYEANASGQPEGNAKKLLASVLQGVWSPDGKRLAYIAIMTESNGDKTGNIVVSNADGSRPQQLTRLHEMGPVGLQWSPDGRRIYFTRPVAPNPEQAANFIIYGMDADGSHLQALTKGDAPDYLGAAPGMYLSNNWIDRIAMMK